MHKRPPAARRRPAPLTGAQALQERGAVQLAGLVLVLGEVAEQHLQLGGREVGEVLQVRQHAALPELACGARRGKEGRRAGC
jgi:hypothetical protein